MSFVSHANLISVIRGSSKAFEITVTDDQDEPVDLTGATMYFTVKRDISEPLPTVRKSSADPTQILIAAPRTGVAKLFLVPGDTHGKSIGGYVFDVWVILVDGRRIPVIPPSQFEVEQGVTVVPL